MTTPPRNYAVRLKVARGGPGPFDVTTLLLATTTVAPGIDVQIPLEVRAPDGTVDVYEFFITLLPLAPTIKLVRVVETCASCPSQWNAWDADGNYFYLRYRYGKGSVWAAKSEHEMEHTGKYSAVCQWRYGDDLDGAMTLEDFAERSGLDITDAVREVE